MPLPVLSIQLFENFRLVYDDALLHSVTTPRLQSLLAYLILHADSPQSRQHLAFLFWPDTPESHARNNLRQLLHQLRQELPDPARFLVSDANLVYWKMDEGQVIDLERFDRALKQADAAKQRGDTNALHRELESAVSLYRGDLLPDCYDDWITPERERLRQECQNAYKELAQVLEGQREYATAVQFAQQHLQFDPLDENAYVVLMRLHVLNDDLPAARRVYQTAVETLWWELGVEPGDALRTAFEHLQQTPRTLRIGADAESRAPLKLIGRQPEWQQLRAAWRRIARGESHVVLVTGEAGIGKSRLSEELFLWVARQGFATAYTRSYGAEGRLTLAPVTDWLRTDTVQTRLKTLGRVWLTEIARLLPELLVEHAALAPPEPITEYGMRQRFFEALARAIRAAPHPILLWIDDLQWCDVETLEWLHYLLRFEAGNAVLILGTARSEESPPEHPVTRWVRQLRAQDQVTILELASLDAAETSKLASQIQGHELDINASVRLFRETQGNPLFVVETVRAEIAGVARLDPGRSNGGGPQIQRLPPRVQAVIAGRLAQLSTTARDVAEIGAASGRSFTFDLLLCAGELDEKMLVQALEELWQRRILREQGANVFDFTHDRLRDVTYGEISAPQQRLLHRRVARALEELYAQDLEPFSAQIAAQYEHAGMPEQAIPYYERAGEFAASMYANEEAINLLARGLELLTQLPPNANRDAQELRMQLVLAPLYTTTRGWPSPEVERSLTRALSLCDKVADKARRAQTLYRLQTMYAVQGRFLKTLEMYPEMHRLFVETQGTLPAFGGVFHAIGTFHTGHIREARELFEGIAAVRDDKHLRSLQASHSGNYLVQAHSYIAHASWLLGYPEAALDHMKIAMQVADEFAQPFNQAFALTYSATLQLWRADVGTFRIQSEQAYAFASEYRVLYYQLWANNLLCFARAWQLPDAQTLAGLRDAIRSYMDSGARARLSLYFSLLGRAHLKAGQIEAGLDAVEQAITHSRQNSELWWDSEIHRLRGELLLAKGADPHQVETEWRRALDIASAQQARSFELRAATSLAGLWQASSRTEDAERLLAPLYASFSEGFDTPDLQAARALLDHLGKSRHKGDQLTVG